MDKTQFSLTQGERLLITRKRLGESQLVSAKRLGVSRNTYGELERDADTISDTLHLHEVGSLSMEEKCLVLRRRSGMTQEECAHELGVTRFWYNQMESGIVSNKALADYWGVNT